MTTTTAGDLLTFREVHAPSSRIPWYAWCGALAVTSASIGGNWDVSWHRSVGRDSFWTPAHMAIYACGVLAAAACGYLILAATFGKSESLQAASVRVFGFRAPLGAFIAAWGGIAMLTSAPFDNWWHNAYGLDVKIVSPPHTLLILGTRAVSAGVLFLLLAGMNRAAEAGATAGYKSFQRLFLYTGGLIVGGQMFFVMEYTWYVYLHSAGAYIAIAIAVPVVLALLSEASRHPWAATVAAAIYMLIAIGEILILPLFPAHPKLGPVYHQVTHMVPANFPILLVAPAVALDLLGRYLRFQKPWLVAAVSGVAFVAVLVLFEWWFADFLMSPWSRNRFFGTTYFGYNSRPEGYEQMHRFYMPDHGWVLAAGLARAAFYAFLSSWVGLRFGRWMRTVQR